MSLKLNPSWPRVSASLFYDNAAEAIDWLCKAYGFEVRLKIEGENGAINHSELVMDDGLIMVSTSNRRPMRKSPRSTGGVNTQSLAVYVEDVDAHYARARAAGAKIISEPSTTDHGKDYWADRSYETEDCEGHRWWFMQRVRNRA